MLKIENLTIVTHKGRTLVKDFSFVLNDSDKIALIGEEGNGKSTLIKIMAGIDVGKYATYTGKILCTGKIAYMPQKISEDHYDEDLFTYIVRNENDIDYSELYNTIKKVNIDPRLFDDKHSIKTLSGGEKVKASLARLLYERPDILLLDEPTNDLDLQTLIWLEEFIKNDNRAIIFISHDETLLENCSNGIIHLEQLKRKTETKITYSGENYKEYTNNRAYNIKRNNEIAAKEKAEYHKQLDKYRQIYQKVEHRQNNISRQDPHGGALLKKKMHAVKSLGKNLENKEKNLTQKFEPEEAINIFFNQTNINPNKTIIELINFNVMINGCILIKNINMKILARDKLCIIGANGTGKSTLIKEIYNSLKYRDDIKLGYMPQNYYEIMNYDLDPIKYLLEKHNRQNKTAIQNLLGSLKFTMEEMEHKISDLSEGQKCKLMFAKLILDNSNVLLLDEPTRNLSPLSNPVIREMLIKFDGCIIAVSHDRKFIEEVTTKIYQIDNQNLKKLM